MEVKWIEFRGTNIKHTTTSICVCWIFFQWLSYQFLLIKQVISIFPWRKNDFWKIIFYSQYGQRVFFFAIIIVVVVVGIIFVFLCVKLWRSSIFLVWLNPLNCTVKTLSLCWCVWVFVVCFIFPSDYWFLNKINIVSNRYVWPLFFLYIFSVSLVFFLFFEKSAQQQTIDLIFCLFSKYCLSVAGWSWNQQIKWYEFHNITHSRT